VSNIENGFVDFASDIAEITEVITDEKVHADVLEKGAKPIVQHAKMLAPKRTRKLVQSIGAEYRSAKKGVEIGIGPPVDTGGATGFYGRFQNDGWRPAAGRRKRWGGRFISRRSAGKVPPKYYLQRSLDAQEGNAYRIITEELRTKLKGVGAP